MRSGKAAERKCRTSQQPGIEPKMKRIGNLISEEKKSYTRVFELSVSVFDFVGMDNGELSLIIIFLSLVVTQYIINQ